jgi:hypothetical protein
MDELSDYNLNKGRSFRKKIFFFTLSFFFILIFFFSSSYTLSQIVGFLILVFFSILIVKPKDFFLFYGFFFTSIITSRLLVFQFFLKNGTIFIGGGDDEVYNQLAHDLAFNQLDLLDPVFLAMPYKLYLYLLAFWIKINLYFVTGSTIKNFHFLLLLLNSFLGSLVVCNIKNILNQIEILNRLLPYQKIIVFFNPFIIYYSSVLLREIIVVLFISTAIIYILSDKNVYLKIIIAIVCFVSLFFIRPSSAMLIVFFSLNYLFLNFKTYFNKILLIILVGLFIYLIIPYLDSILGKNIEMRISNIMGLAAENSMENSFGNKILQSDNKLIKLLIPFYILVSPIPPPIFTAFNFKSVIISAGSILWLFTLIFYFAFLFRFFFRTSKSKITNPKYQLYVIITANMLLFNSIIVGYGAIDPRHHLILYPIITPLVFVGQISKGFLKFKYYYLAVFYLLYFSVIGYIVLKILFS